MLIFGLCEGRAFAQTINVTVDARAAGTPLKRVWSFFGYDEGNYTTVPQGEALLKTLGKLNSVPAYIRPHFLLNTGDGTPAHKWGSTNAYTEDSAGKPVYSWTILDGIMDTFKATGNLPLAEIGFMPQALSVHPNPYRNSDAGGVATLDGGCFYPPKDYDKWAGLIGEWAKHSKERYPDTVNAWLWEMWNEPNIRYWYGTDAEYYKLYDYTEGALHAVLPDATLGGPAVLGADAMLKGFLQHCDNGVNAKTKQAGTRLDMVSFHAKGGVALSDGHPQMNLGNQLRIHRDGFTIIAGFSKYKQTPIVITEADPDGCAACANAQNAYRNSPAYGAYIISMMKGSLDLEARLGVNLKGLVTWAFMFDDDKYFSVLRTLSTNGIDKPVLNAFKLLGALNGQRLPITSSGARSLDDVLKSSVRAAADIDSLASFDGSQVQVLVWNYHDDLVTVPASPVHLTVSLPASFGPSATVTHSRVDETHGDTYTVWVKQGSPQAPTPAQRAELEQAMQPAVIEAAHPVPISNGTATVDFSLPRFGVSLLTFTSPTAQGGAGGGGASGSGSAGASSAGASSAGSADTDGGMNAASGSASGGALGTVAGAGASGSGGVGNTTSSAGTLNGSSGIVENGISSPHDTNSGCACSVFRAHEAEGQRGPWFYIPSVAMSVLLFSRRRARRAGARCS